jgi:hypothetical protein
MGHGRCAGYAGADMLVEQQPGNKLRPCQQSVRTTVELKRMARRARFQGGGDSTGPRRQ